MYKFFSVIFFILITFTHCAEFSEIFGGQTKSSNNQSPPETTAQLEKRYHEVVAGDTLPLIAQKYEVTEDLIIDSNLIDDPQKLTVGQKLYIPYPKENVQVATLPPSPEVITETPPGEVSQEPAVLSSEPEVIPPEEGVVQEPSRFIWPVDGVVTSGFGDRHGRLHDGIDISAPLGSPVCAANTGKVIYVGRMSGYGNLVILKHSENYFTAYAHMRSYKVKKGETVKQGAIIGEVGRTGRAKSPHLHFEVRHKTASKNPLELLPEKIDLAQKERLP